MAQVRRKPQARAKKKRANHSKTFKTVLGALWRSLGVFSFGAFCGVLGLYFFQGYQSESQVDMGSGLKEIINLSKRRAEQREKQTLPVEPILVDKALRIKPEYDFYTVLPTIEEVLPDDVLSSPKVTSVKVTKAKVKKLKVTKPLKKGSTYMLQVASYGHEEIAKQLKAKLALGGMRATIQKVRIDNKQYFRVRMGPYTDYGSMTSDDYRLSQMGHKALRLRISKAG